MSDADWWLCACQSLNNLSARRCYSCRRPKPKTPVRASELLGYRVVVAWDGKVRMEERRPEVEVPIAPRRPPPLREPVLRSIVAVAPPPPEGARITYWLGDPALDPRRPATAPPPQAWLPAQPPLGPAAAPPLLGLAARPGEAPPPPSGIAPSTPVGETSSARPVVGIPVVASPPPPAPAVAVHVVSGPSVDHGETPPSPSWPHWRELLDGPRPDAARLRRTPEATSQRLRARLAGPATTEWRPAAPSSARREPAYQDLAEPIPTAGPAPSSAGPVFWPAEPTSWPAADTMAARRPDPSAT